MKLPQVDPPEEADGSALMALREAPAPRMDPFTERRLRAAVVRGQAMDGATGASSRGRKRPLRTGLLLLAACIGGALLLGGLQLTRSAVEEPSGAAANPTASAATPTEITVLSGQAPTRVLRDGVERVSLSEGRYLFRAHQQPQGPRLLVLTPDGEIEDVGTVFEVVVAPTQTKRISVLQGEVVFRRPGQPELRLVAGERYDAHESSAAEVVAEQPPTAPAPAIADLPRSPASAPPGGRPPAPAASANHDAEDSAYMRVVALLREGRSEEAKIAAREYLKRYPDGFRRMEMQRVGE